MNLANSSQLKIDGAVTIRLTGRLNVVGAARINDSTAIPGRLRILSSYSGVNGVTISNNASVFMVVYAPQTGFNISGTASLSGTVVAKSISVVTGGMVHYDTETKDVWEAIWNLIGAQ
jgi:hypothetical protein